ncbi:MAG: extracellular solute-binding protein [Candidatus Zixiibacteriota bacterium]|nr:MAG: extracellular solute-binding protein [candidate division Zixibacteria bacterium]
MMKQTKFLISVVITAAAVIMSCSGEAEQKAEVTLEWWQFWTDPAIKPAIETMVADYEAANPNVKINLSDLTWANGHEKIVVAFSSGTAPDIIELGSDWVAEFSSADQLADITKDVLSDTALYNGWSPGIYNDRIYAFPWILGTRVLFVNRELMKRAGFGESFLPINWPQLKELCYKIDSLSDDIYGFGSNAAEKHRLYKKFLPFLWASDGRIISKNGKYAVFASEKSYNALKFYKELSDSCSMVDTQRRLEDAFLTSKVGVIISGDWLLKRIKNENIQLNFTTTLIPGPEYPGKSFAGGEYLAVSTTSPNKAEALRFIRHVTGRENQLLFCKANYSASPSDKQAAEDEFFKGDVNLQTFIKQLNMSRMTPATPRWVYVEDVIESALEEVLFNDAPVAESLYEANKKIKELIFQ